MTRTPRYVPATKVSLEFFIVTSHPGQKRYVSWIITVSFFWRVVGPHWDMLRVYSCRLRNHTRGAKNQIWVWCMQSKCSIQAPHVISCQYLPPSISCQYSFGLLVVKNPGELDWDSDIKCVHRAWSYLKEKQVFNVPGCCQNNDQSAFHVASMLLVWSFCIFQKSSTTFLRKKIKGMYKIYIFK